MEGYNQKELYSLVRVFSVGMALFLDDNEGICIQLNKDTKDTLFSDCKVIVYKQSGTLKITQDVPDTVSHGQKVKITEELL